MAAADRQGPVPDLHQLLGVSRDASREQSARAWRHRARAGHPDARPGGGTGPVPGPPLRAGPVRVDGPPAAPAGGREEDEIRGAVLAALAPRRLARARDRGGLW